MAKKTEEKSYRDYIDMKRIPILPLDNRWHQLFPENNKPARIKKLEKEVMTLVKKESSVNQDLKNLVKAKKKLMNQIVNNMQETTPEIEKVRQKKLAASQKLILDINKKTNALENEKYNLPYRLIQANEELLIESIEICYNRIQNNQEKIAFLNEWIDRTRTELKRNVVVRQELADMNHNIYSYMHDMFGPRFMEVFDSSHEYRADYRRTDNRRADAQGDEDYQTEE